MVDPRGTRGVGPVCVVLHVDRHPKGKGPRTPPPVLPFYLVVTTVFETRSLNPELQVQ